MHRDPISLSPQFVANALLSGEAGARWLSELPGLVADSERRWGLRVHQPFDLTYNYIAAADRADGSAAVLKIGFPGDPGFRSELEALQASESTSRCQMAIVSDPSATSPSRSRHIGRATDAAVRCHPTSSSTPRHCSTT